MNNRNGFKDSRTELESYIKSHKHPEKTNEALRETFDALCKLLPDAMAVPQVGLAITLAATLGDVESRPDILKAGIELGQAKGRLAMAILRVVTGKGALVANMENIEREIIRTALDSTVSKGAASKLLGIPQSTLSTKLKRFGLTE